jgi:hypothetical protein
MDKTVSIEFGLPNGASGQAAVHHSSRLRKSITKWAEERHVAVGYSTGHREYRHWLTVEFDKESDLTLFVLSWNGDSFMPWRRVDTAYILDVDINTGNPAAQPTVASSYNGPRGSY